MAIFLHQLSTYHQFVRSFSSISLLFFQEYRVVQKKTSYVFYKVKNEDFSDKTL